MKKIIPMSLILQHENVIMHILVDETKSMKIKLYNRGYIVNIPRIIGNFNKCLISILLALNLYI